MRSSETKRSDVDTACRSRNHPALFYTFSIESKPTDIWLAPAPPCATERSNSQPTNQRPTNKPTNKQTNQPTTERATDRPTDPPNQLPQRACPLKISMDGVLVSTPPQSFQPSPQTCFSTTTGYETSNKPVYMIINVCSRPPG